MLSTVHCKLRDAFSSGKRQDVANNKIEMEGFYRSPTVCQGLFEFPRQDKKAPRKNLRFTLHSPNPKSPPPPKESGCLHFAVQGVPKLWTPCTEHSALTIRSLPCSKCIVVAMFLSPGPRLLLVVHCARCAMQSKVIRMEQAFAPASSLINGWLLGYPYVYVMHPNKAKTARENNLELQQIVVFEVLLTCCCLCKFPACPNAELMHFLCKLHAHLNANLAHFLCKCQC